MALDNVINESEPFEIKLLQKEKKKCLDHKNHEQSVIVKNQKALLKSNQCFNQRANHTLD